MKGMGILIPAVLAAAAAVSAAEYKVSYTTAPVGTNVRVQAVAISPAPRPYAKPILFVEGFDMDDGADMEFDLEEFESKMSTAKATLLAQGYTVVLVDLETNWADLKDNAKATGRLMQLIWEDSRKAEEIQIVGLSMGGLVATLAARIKQFETTLKSPSPADLTMYNGWNFKCNLALSFDSPHKGAYVPTGLRAFLDFFHTKPGGNASDHPWRAMTSTAASQMIMVKGQSIQAWNLRTQWQSYYDEYLAWLKPRRDVRLAGIAKGSWNGEKQYAGDPIGKLNISFHKDPDYCGEAKSNIYTQGRSDREVYYGYFGFCTSYERVTIYDGPGYPNFENAPGGTLDGWADLADKVPGKPTPAYANFSFVPTFSAAALDYATFSPNSKDNFAQNETTMGPMENYSGLHQIYHHNGPNEMHKDISPADLGWMLAEFRKAGRAAKLAPILSILLQ